jgi:formylglycine-generating enzyme required for sulfatase activity
MLLKELENPATSEQRRLRIGDDLALLGDPRPGVGLKEGVPDILWLPVAGTNSEKVEFETDGGSIGHFEVTPFYIARYQVTDGQYQAFVTAEDGYNNKMWWHDFPEQYQPQRLNEQRTKFINNPRDSISWYQAVAFGRWMTHRCKGLALPNPYNPTERYVIGENAEIRIPTEWEWQWAAQNGAEKRQYPWGEWQRGYTDTSESGLGRPIAVGMYPHGAAVCGALDMAGNLWEWCMNKKDTPEFTAADTSGDSRVLRGGSFSYSQNLARSVYRYYYNPYNVFNYYGFRVVFAPILRL